MIETISISKVAELLVYTDMRSVMNWAKKNQVEIFVQGKRKFMIREQFEEVYQKPFINRLNKPPASYAESYKPRGKHEKAFINKILQKA